MSTVAKSSVRIRGEDVDAKGEGCMGLWWSFFILIPQDDNRMIFFGYVAPKAV